MVVVRRSRRYRWATGAERINNRLTRFGLRRGVAPKAFALLETTGRRSRLPRHTPVGNSLVDGNFWLIAFHGEQADLTVTGGLHRTAGPCPRNVDTGLIARRSGR